MSSPLSSFRVVIDARALSHPQRGGFQSATRALVQGMGELYADEYVSPNDVEILLYLDRPLAPNVATQISPRLQTRILSPNRLQTDLFLFAQQVRRDRPDLVHGLMNYVPMLGPTNQTPTTVTIHDALGIKAYPFSRTPRTEREKAIHMYTRWTTLRSAGAAKRIATDSYAAATELREALADTNQTNLVTAPLDGIQIVYPGVALAPPSPEEVETRGKRRGQHVLVMASPDPRKNLDPFFGTWVHNGLAMRRDLTLRVVCGSDVTKSRTAERLEQLGITNVKIHRNPSGKKLAKLYSRSDLFMFPSLWEGFGLPPLEAMLCGCAVAASDAPCLPETLGDAPLFFAPNDPGAMAKAVVHLLKDKDERTTRAEMGRAWASRYTCRAYAGAMVDFWRKAMSASL